MRAGDGQICLHRRARNAAHNMQAKAQAKRMNVMRQRAEAAAPLGGGKTVWRRLVQAMMIHHVLPGRAAVAVGIAQVPAFVNDHVTPAITGQMPGHKSRLSLELPLRDAQGETIPAIPAHGRGGGQRGFRCALCRGATGKQNQET